MKHEKTIARMKEDLKDQDNRITAHPMYLVQVRVHVSPGHMMWKFVDVFFTERAANEFIKFNQHNYNELRVYVASGYRNPEWQAVRELLIGDDRDD